jgi:hypothetical protein
MANVAVSNLTNSLTGAATAVGDFYLVDDISVPETKKQTAAELALMVALQVAPNQLKLATASLDMNTQKILNVVNPTSPQEAATKNYVDSYAAVADLIVFNRQTASYTLVLSDRSDMVEMNVASANNLTVPTNATVPFPIGTSIAVSQYGAGATTIVPAGGVTLRSRGADLTLAGQYAVVTLIKVGTDEWYVTGDL